MKGTVYGNSLPRGTKMKKKKSLVTTGIGYGLVVRQTAD